MFLPQGQTQTEIAAHALQLFVNHILVTFVSQGQTHTEIAVHALQLFVNLVLVTLRHF